jgi:hypothetical protein
LDELPGRAERIQDGSDHFASLLGRQIAERQARYYGFHLPYRFSRQDLACVGRISTANANSWKLLFQVADESSIPFNYEKVFPLNPSLQKRTGHRSGSGANLKHRSIFRIHARHHQLG